MIRIIIADDHELIREGIKKIIRSSKDISIVGEAADIAETIRLVSQHVPDMVVLDLSLPGCEGLSGLTTVLAEFPNLPILVLSMFPEERFAIPVLEKGAVGYLTKTMDAKELLKAIRNIASSGVYISPQVAELLALDSRKAHAAFPHERLTGRELQIASLIGSGRQIKQIAADLAISISTVNTYRNRIFGKMGLRSNAELIRYAVEHHLVVD